MKKLLSFTKNVNHPTEAKHNMPEDHSSASGMEQKRDLGMETEEPMETDLVIDTDGQETGKVQGQVPVPESDDAMMEAESLTLELVDQMEIEISDHEGGVSGAEEKETDKTKKGTTVCTPLTKIRDFQDCCKIAIKCCGCPRMSPTCTSQVYQALRNPVQQSTNYSASVTLKYHIVCYTPTYYNTHGLMYPEILRYQPYKVCFAWVSNWQ